MGFAGRDIALSTSCSRFPEKVLKKPLEAFQKIPKFLRQLVLFKNMSFVFPKYTLFLNKNNFYRKL